MQQIQICSWIKNKKRTIKF